MTRRRRATVLICVIAFAASLLAGAGAGASAATPVVLGHTVIGTSVQHRPIVAYHLGNPHASVVGVIIGQMHGDERAGVTLARSIVSGTARVGGIDLWVIPTMNPDGYAAHTRQNAHHVDLNRNFPRRWAHLTGQYYSGKAALSEPESRAVYAFLRRVRPTYLVSLHQPLSGVDTTDGGAKDPAFRRRLVAKLDLPAKAFRCWSTCHGSMTNWYTAYSGVGITVEFGPHPSTAYLTGRARTGIVGAMGGRFA